MDKKQENFSGSTYIKHDNIIWESEEAGILIQIPIERIKIIGEYTTDAGPIQDDWFYVFILAENDTRQISAYAKGFDEMLRQLENILSVTIVGQLANSTTWKTNVIWPINLKGQEIYKESEKNPVGILGKMKSKLGLQKREIEFTADLIAYLK